MSRESTLQALLHEHGTTFAEQAGITLADRPSPLFRLLVLTALLSANLDARLGLRTAAVLGRAGFTTARHLADASDDERWQVLSDAKYLRKEQTARQLGDLADQALERYRGDLRRMRDEHADVDDLRGALRDFTGIGAVGADIFCREVQAVWPSLRPYADERVLRLAKARGLPSTAERLARLAGTDDLSLVGAALVSADMAERG
ncbi:endonuclease [Jatrophihabitans endophyticus]|uniref:endonuclease n=1 Tax=Jatrophihabitans endophyticus TaxID=1206085 RepID=UPI0019D86056|nr:endonuclease [Jatrophihabitans endophyticus]MBE7189766.1 endonuclease [Jatrophihabitans endophyticus]